MVPIYLRPTSVRSLWEQFTNVPSVLAEYWPLRDNDKPGTGIDYDVLVHQWRTMWMADRGGPPIYTDPDPMWQIHQEGETWREGKRIGAVVMKDYRMPGSSTQARGQWEVTRRTEELRRAYEWLLNYLRAEGLQGVKDYRPPSAWDLHYDELLLCASTCIDTTPTAPWNTAAATAAIAAANLQNIYNDVQTAVMATSLAGAPADTLILNQITLGYAINQILMAGTGSGFEWWVEVIGRTGTISSFFGMRLDVVNDVYVNPVSGAVNYLIPTNVAIFTSTDNAACGREMIQCEAVHINAPAGTMGLYIDSYEWEEAPGEIRISAEWSGAPVIMNDCGSYVYTDVTAR